MKIKLIFIAGCFALCQNLMAQDTLKLSIEDAEKLFLKNNYQLLLAKYEIEQAKADVITAKLFDNPELSHENLFYNHETKRFLETSYATGQFSTQISQLFKLAGKRNKSIALANTAVKLQEFEYFDLIRTLRYQLRTNFFKLHSLQQSANIYKVQIAALQQLIDASSKQLILGNVAAKDVLRIKSLLYNLLAEELQVKNEMAGLTNDLKLLTQIDAATEIQTISDKPTENQSLNKQAYTTLLEAAKANRIDLKSAQTAITYAQQQLKLQKANAILDVQLSLAYDLKGNYPEKYTGLGISIPIPLFNRNQGEIKRAKVAVEMQEVAFNQLENTLKNEVFQAYQNAERIEKLTTNMDENFHNDYQQLIQEVTNNFKKRNIGLLEFLDFYESFKETTLQHHQLQYERINALEEINFVTGTNIYK
ncbi:TolC family protein [Nubsella zeaxanthinifaciens]|uniref:TolC family protein n=1 Tax=Nubsella zeaxanthinifaciens TaxID=392412 RepID=UPI003D04D976